MKYLNSLNKANDPIVALAIEHGVKLNYSTALESLEKSHSVEAEFLRGLCLIHLHERKRALECFKNSMRKPGANFLVPALCDFITGNESEASKMYNEAEFTRYFQAASNSDLLQDMHHVMENTIRRFPPKGDIYTFVDLGIGTAKQVEKMIRWIPQEWPWVKKVHVIGVEPYAPMIPLARQRMSNLINISPITVEFDLLTEFAQNLTRDSILNLLNHRPPDLINACLAIHHMRKEEKLHVLKVIQSCSPKLFVLTDAESDHESDVPELSFELISNVISHYEAVLRCLLSEKPDSKTEEHYRAFCFYDAKNILMPSDRRIEYHTTAERWVGYLESVGLKVLSPSSDWMSGVKLKTGSVKERYLVPASDGRPVNFQIVAASEFE